MFTEPNKLTRKNKKDFKNFEGQVEALDAFIKLTTGCLTLNNPRVEGEKDKIYSILVSLNIVFPQFFEELTTFDSLKIHDKQEIIRQNLKYTQLEIRNTINLLKEATNLDKVEQTPTAICGENLGTSKNPLSLAFLYDKVSPRNKKKGILNETGWIF